MPDSRSCLAIVLAAGEGVRMRSSLPKALHALAGRPMLAHLLEAVAAAGIESVALVVGPGRDDVAARARVSTPLIEVFIQAERRGTAHAALTARSAVERGYDDIVVLFADTPLLEPPTIVALRAPLAHGAAVSVLGFEPGDPHGYGRLLMEGERLCAVREEKDASEEERRVRACNAGAMAFDGRRALDLLDSISDDNAQKEFYLTEAVRLANARGWTCAVEWAPFEEVLGVNDRIQLAAAEVALQHKLRTAAMRAGATLLDPASVTLSWDTRLGQDVLVEPHVFFGPGVVVEDGAAVRAFSHLVGAHVQKHASVGPFARLRPGARVSQNAKVGNFVEIKNADIGVGAAVSHLSYIGDASVGARANVGAGAITCNYDGFDKRRTIIGEGAFIGSNASLVAPVTVGAGAYVGSGSVITRDVAPEALALARALQVEKADWAKRFRDARARKKSGES